MNIEPVSGALGAQISDIDLAEELSADLADSLRQAFLRYHVLFFSGQQLDPQAQLRFAQVFGEPEIYPFIEGLPETPEVIDIIKTEADVVNFGGSWHSDTSYMPEPALGTVLHALEVPATGGDTLFANTAAAYQALSAGMRKMLEGVNGVYNSDNGYGGSRARAMTNIDGMKDAYQQVAETYESEHPIIRTHPESGLKGIYVGRGHTARFKDMTVEESRPLIHFLTDHIVRPEFTCRFRWAVGAVAVWDNRITQHYAVNDYPGQRRHMRRVTIKGDRPR